MLSALEESAAELPRENARGDSSKTVTLIDLKIEQRDSEPKITLYTKFHRNLRARMFWLGRFVLERPRRRHHGSLEGVGGVLISEVCHLKADTLVITETQLFWESIDAFFKNYSL